MIPCAPQNTPDPDSDDDSDIVPPWDTKAVRGKIPLSAALDLSDSADMNYRWGTEQGAELERARKELLSELVRLVCERIAATEKWGPLAVKVFEASLIDGRSLRELAKEMGVSKDTVDRAVKRFKAGMRRRHPRMGVAFAQVDRVRQWSLYYK